MTTFVAAVPKSNPMTKSTVLRRADRSVALVSEASLDGSRTPVSAGCAVGPAASLSETPSGGGPVGTAPVGTGVSAGILSARLVSGSVVAARRAQAARAERSPAAEPATGRVGPAFESLAEVRAGDFERRRLLRNSRPNHFQRRPRPIRSLTPPGSGPRRSRPSARTASGARRSSAAPVRSSAAGPLSVPPSP